MVSELKNLTYEGRLIKKNATKHTFEEKRKRTLNYNIQIDEQPGSNKYKNSNIEKKKRSWQVEGRRKYCKKEFP